MAISRLNRSIPPSVHNIKAVHFPKVDRYRLDNGIEVIAVNQGTQDIVRIEIIYDASRTVEDKPLVSRFAAALQKEGTVSYDAESLAEKTDYYGATLSSGSNLDYTYFTLFSLAKYFVDVIPLLAEVIEQPTFSQSELEKFKITQLESLKSNLAKSDLTSYRKITELMFGANHPYGYNSTKEYISSITRDDLVQHYTDYHTADRCHIIISGKLSGQIRDMLNTHLGQKRTESKSKIYTDTIVPITRSRHTIHSEQDQQTAIKIGRRMFSRKHTDFSGAFVLNTVLGGYFGSRLMVRIREELGYTYNIYSSLDPLVYDGYMMISTEVSNALVDNTISEIYHQMEMLKQERIPNQELVMIRNYVMGNFLNMIDGPFRIANVMKTLCVTGFDIEYQEKIIDQIYSCTTEQIMDLAQIYLRKEDMIEVLVGNQY